MVTHRTDEMIKTSEFLAQYIKNKTIVLTGVIVPYVFESSDGLFNLGSTLAFVQTLPYGFYIPMNGIVFPWNNLRKKKEKFNFPDKYL